MSESNRDLTPEKRDEIRQVLGLPVGPVHPMHPLALARNGRKQSPSVKWPRIKSEGSDAETHPS